MAHIFFAWSETTSLGEKDSSKEVARVVNSDEDLSCILDAFMMAWHRSDLKIIRHEISERYLDAFKLTVVHNKEWIPIAREARST